MNNTNRVRNYGMNVVNSARNGDAQGMQSNITRMNTIANNAPLTPRETRQILNTVIKTHNEMNKISQNLNTVKRTLNSPLVQNSKQLRFSSKSNSNNV